MEKNDEELLEEQLKEKLQLKKLLESALMLPLEKWLVNTRSKFLAKLVGTENLVLLKKKFVNVAKFVWPRKRLLLKEELVDKLNS